MYLSKICERAKQVFIEKDRVNVSGIIVAGLAELKTELVADKMFDPRLKAKVLRTVDISYGSDRGLHEAIVLAEDILADAMLTKERKLLESFFLQVSQTDGNYATGTKEVLFALEQGVGVVDLLLCWEDLPTIRFTLRNSVKNGKCQCLLNLKITNRLLKLDEMVINYNPSARKQPSVGDLLASKGVDPTGYEIVDSVPLVDWLCENYTRFGARLEFVSRNTDQGAQFVDGFGGIGAVLRYHIDFDDFEDQDSQQSESDEDDQDDFMFDAFEDNDDDDDALEDDDWAPEKKKGSPPSDKKKAADEDHHADQGDTKKEPPVLEFVAARAPQPPRQLPSVLDLSAPVFLPKSKRSVSDEGVATSTAPSNLHN